MKAHLFVHGYLLGAFDIDLDTVDPKAKEILLHDDEPTFSIHAELPGNQLLISGLAPAHRAQMAECPAPSSAS